MRIALTICTVLMAMFSYCSVGRYSAKDIEVSAASLSAATASALSHADVALARSYIVQNDFKGCFGESIAEKSFTREFLSKSGNWKSVTPRSGRQGLDHLFVKTKSGAITDIMVCESKFNTSNLGRLTNGEWQMGDWWVRDRLRKLGNGYTLASNRKISGFRKAPLGTARKYAVELKNGKMVYFWSKGKGWFFTGSKAELQEARSRSANWGRAFLKAYAGELKYRGRIFKIIPRGSDAEVVIYDSKKVVNGNLKSATPTGGIRLKGALSSWDAVSAKDLASQIQRKSGLSDADSIIIAKKVLDQNSVRELMGEYSLTKTVAMNTLKATVLGVALDAGIQLLLTQDLDGKMLSLSAGGVAFGATVGQVTHMALTRPTGYYAVKKISGPLRITTPTATSLVSSVAGGVATSAVLSYGAYFLGYGDLKTANRQMIIGSASAGAGAAFTSGAMLMASTYGVAGTGTAISSLSGAAATNASLAWLGGGTVASGGGGMAAGAAVLTGGALFVAAGVAVVGYYGYMMYDQHEDTLRICSELDCYREDPDCLDAILSNDCRYRGWAVGK